MVANTNQLVNLAKFSQLWRKQKNIQKLSRTQGKQHLWVVVQNESKQRKPTMKENQIKDKSNKELWNGEAIVKWIHGVF